MGGTLPVPVPLSCGKHGLGVPDSIFPEGAESNFAPADLTLVEAVEIVDGLVAVDPTARLATVD